MPGIHHGYNLLNGCQEIASMKEIPENGHFVSVISLTSKNYIDSVC